jgi:PAS domain S-box-containing protein
MTTAGTQSAPTVEAGLLERIQYAPDLDDACHLVLEEIFRVCDFQRAVVVVRHQDHLHAVGHGVSDERLLALTSPTEASGAALRDLMDAGESRPLEARELPELDFEAVSLLVLPGPRGIPAGALLLDDPSSKGTGALTGPLRTLGPTLARLLEVAALRKRIARVDRHAALLDTVVDSLADPVILTDAQNSFLFANRRAEHLFSARSHESEGRRRAVRINDLLFSSFLTEAVISGGEPVSRELNLVNPSDGSDLLFEVFTVPLPAGAGREGAVISVLRDITDLKRALTELELQFSRSRVAEQAARRESDRLNAILANVSDPILVTDNESRIILLNGEAERLFDASSDRIDTKKETTWQAVRANDTKFTTLISDFLLQPDTRRAENILLDDPVTGRELPIEVQSTKILSPRGEVSAIVSVLHDLTPVVDNARLARELRVLNEGLEERVRLSTEELEERNRRLEWQSRELQKASRLKSEFLASMSHELRTPINAMLGYTALLQEKIYGELSDKQDNALRKIYGASQHLLALINDILDLSRIEAGKMPIRVEEVRLTAIVQELSQAIEPMVREKGLDYRAELSGELPLLMTDRTKIKQILLNLLSNAVKFTPEGSVVLRAHPVDGGERFRVEVQDTGIGIENGDLQTIFDDFRQVDQSSTRQYGGTGLGLSITRKLVTLLKGSIEVDSRYGRGSTFTVELPATLSPDDGDHVTMQPDEHGEGQDRPASPGPGGETPVSSSSSSSSPSSPSSVQ